MTELLADSDWPAMADGGWPTVADGEGGGWKGNGYECGKRKWNKSKQEKWKKKKKEESGGGGCARRAIFGKWGMWVFWAVSGVGERRKKMKNGEEEVGGPGVCGCSEWSVLWGRKKDGEKMGVRPPWEWGGNKN